MTNPIHFVAVSDGYAYFGVAEDPVAAVSAMQTSTPVPIELAAGWAMPPQARGRLQERVLQAFRPLPHRGEWVKVPRTHAVFTLALHARELGGQEWRVRKRSRQKTKNDRRTRAVVTPHGRYPSAAAAAAAIGISRQSAWERAYRRSPGWHFEDDAAS